MQESINFTYDGISSSDMGVLKVSIEDGLFEEPFLPSRSVVEIKTVRRDKPYLQRVDYTPLFFYMRLYISDWSHHGSLRKIARWLFQPYYKPLIFESNPNRVFYAMLEGDATLFHNGNKEGYVDIGVRCDSPYSYSAEYNVENIEFRDTNQSVIVTGDSSNFENGIHDNTIETSNGLTVKDFLDTWGRLYSNAQKWGDIN